MFYQSSLCSLRINPILPILAFDDYGEKRTFPVHGFINPSISANRQWYPEYLLKSSYIGPHFFLLRSDLHMLPAVQRDSILLNTGGSDPEDQTLRLLKILKSIENINQVNILIGPGYTKKDDLDQYILGNDRFKLIYNPSNLADILNQSRI
jgi:spore coat polysaccharide biosynthesis predicted glycosyltransferase SpsG